MSGCFVSDYSSSIIASTGQFSSAASQQPTNSHASESMTCDFPDISSTWKTAGHISSQFPQPMHNSSSTLTFTLIFYILINNEARKRTLSVKIKNGNLNTKSGKEK